MLLETIKNNMTGVTSKNYWKVFLKFLLVASLIFLPFLILENGIFTYIGDYIEQQIPFYQMCHEAVRNGSLGWNWTTGMGTGLVGSYTYYCLCSPFFWLMLPFPTTWVPYLMAPMLALKIALAGLAAYAFIRRYVKRDSSAVIASLLYAFCGWSIFNIFFNQFHESFLIYPLVLLALDKLVIEKKSGWFAISIAAAAFINYYFFVGMAIFLVIYFLVRSFCHGWDMTLGIFGKALIEAIIGVIIAAVCLFPSAIAVLSMDRMTPPDFNGRFSMLISSAEYYVQLLFNSFLPTDGACSSFMLQSNTYRWSSITAYLPIFGLSGVFAFTSKNKKHWVTVLLAVSAVCLCVPLLNSMFNLFTAPNYTRWLYMPILFMCMATAFVFDSDDITLKKSSKLYIIISAVIFIIVALFTLFDGTFSTFGPATLLYFFVYVMVTVYGLILCNKYSKMFDIDRDKFRRGIFSTLAFFIVIQAIVTIQSGKGYSFTGVYINDNYINQELEIDDTDENYRIDTNFCLRNASMYFNYSSPNCFQSIVPQSTLDFLTFMESRDGTQIVLDRDRYQAYTLLSTKYVVTEEKFLDINQIWKDELNDEDSAKTIESYEKYGTALLPGYKSVGETETYTILENENFLPFGFVFDSYINLEELISEENKDKYTVSDKSALLLKGIMLTNSQIEKYGYMFKEYDISNYDAESYTEDEYASDCKSITKFATNFKKDASGFTCDYTAEKDELIFFSIPYDEGWTALVNDNEAYVDRVDVGFMAVSVKAGVNHIKFTYTTPGLSTGLNVSIAGVVMLILYLLLMSIKKALDFSSLADIKIVSDNESEERSDI